MSKKRPVADEDVIIDDDPFGSDDVIIDDDPFGEGAAADPLADAPFVSPGLSTAKPKQPTAEQSVHPDIDLGIRPAALPSESRAASEQEDARSTVFQTYHQRQRDERTAREEYDALQQAYSNARLGERKNLERRIGEASDRVVKLANRNKSMDVTVDRELSSIVKQETRKGVDGWLKDEDGKRVPDPATIMVKAKEIALKYAVDDKDFTRNVYNRLMSGLEAKIVEPEAKRLNEERSKPVLDEYGKTLWKGFTTDSVEYAKASQKMKLVQDSIGAEAKREADSVNAAVKERVSEMNMAWGSVNEEHKTNLDLLQQAVNSGQVPFEQAQQSKAEIDAWYNQQRAGVAKEFSAIGNEAVRGIAAINTRANKQNAEQQRRILAEAESVVNEAAKKHAEQFGNGREALELRWKLNDIYKQSWADATKARQQELHGAADARFDADRLLFGPVNAMVNRFGESTVTGLGGAIKGLSTTVGSDSGWLLGEVMERSYLMSKPETKNFSDLLDAKNFSQLSGQLAGGMAPSLVAAAGTAAVTSGVGAPAALGMVTSAMAGWGAETTQIAGNVRDQVFERTGNAAKADEAAWRSFQSQVQLLPAYSFEGLPFVSGALKFVPTKLGRMLVGGAVEYGTEMFQEIPQGIAERNILNGHDPWENFTEGLSAPSEEGGPKWGMTKETLVQMAPISLLGAGGQLTSKGAKKDLEDMVKAYVAKADASKYVEDAAAQWVSSMSAEKGEAFSAAVIASLYTSGHISEQQAIRLDLLRMEAMDSRADARSAGLNDREAAVYAAFTAKATDMQAKAEGEDNPILKKFYEGRAKELETTTAAFLAGQEAQYVTIDYPDGTSLLLDPLQAKRMLGDPDFARRIALVGMGKDGVSVRASGAESATLVDEFAERVRAAGDYAASVALDPENAQLTVVELREGMQNAAEENNRDDDYKDTGDIEDGGTAVEPVGPGGVDEQKPGESGKVEEKPVGKPASASPEVPGAGETKAGIPPTVEARVEDPISTFNQSNPDLEDIDVSEFEGLKVGHVSITERIGDKRVIATVETDQGPQQIMLDKVAHGPSGERVEAEQEEGAGAVPDDRTGLVAISQFSNENESYRVVVGEEAYNDIVESGVVRTNSERKSKKEGGVDLSNRPTAFPSFSRGRASIEYAAENPNNYIIVTSDSSIQPSKSGRHGKGTTMFPTDLDGNHLRELSGEKVKVYKHAGDGMYELVYENGKAVDSSRPIEIGAKAETPTKEKKPEAPKAEKQHPLERGFPDAWRDTLIKTRVAAKDLIDRGRIPDNDDTKAIWTDHPALIKLVEKGLEAPMKKPSAEAKPTPKKPLSNLSDEDQTKAAEALAKLKSKLKGGGKAFSGAPVDPELIEAAVEYGYYAVKSGYKSFADWSRHMVESVGDEIKDKLKAIYNRMRSKAEDKAGYSTMAEVSKADIDRILTEESDGTESGKDLSGESGDSGGDPGVGDGGVPKGGAAGGKAGGTDGGQVPPNTGGAGSVEGGSAEAPGVDGDGGGDAGSTSNRPGGRTEEEGSGPGATVPPKGGGPGVDPNAVDHALPQDEDWIPSGDKAKAKANLAAVELLIKLELENREATTKEKTVLAQYVGWGGLKPAVDLQKAKLAEHFKAGRIQQYRDDYKTAENWIKNWGDTHEQLKAVMDEDEMNSIYHASEFQHFSSREVIRFGIWDALVRMGFKGGSMLEAAVGLGHFIGMTPEALRGKIKWLAIDSDALAARIAKKLYPQQDVRHSGYEDVRIKPNSIDASATNVPFSQTGVYHKGYENLNLHNYFIIRQLDELKPGGIGAIITSSWTMDSADRTARKMMMDRADLVGAIRLPNTAFKKNAGTSVTADILFFRKRDQHQFEARPFERTVPTTSAEGWKDTPVNWKGGSVEDWHKLSDEQKTEEIRLGRLKSNVDRNDGKQVYLKEFRVNEYFVNNPHMVLGDLSLQGTQYGGGEMTVKPSAVSLEDGLKAAVATLPQNIFQAAPTESQDEAPKAEEGARVGRLELNEEHGFVAADIYGKLIAPSWLTKSRPAAEKKKLIEQAKEYLKLRDASEAMVSAEKRAASTEEELAKKRATLNEQYDSYVKAYGHVRDKESEYLHTDRDFPQVAGLENRRTATKEEVIKAGKGLTKRALDKLIGKTTWVYEKMPIFFERATNPVVRPEKADSLGDAIDISLNWTNYVDVNYIADMLGISEEKARAALRESENVFENPRTGAFEEPHIYLSEFVVDKLSEARVAAESDPYFEKNVLALERVQPKRIGIADIIRPKEERDAPQVGNHWIPTSVYEGFAKHYLGIDFSVSLTETIGKFSVGYNKKDYHYKATRNTVTHGVKLQKSQGRRAAGTVHFTGAQIYERLLRQGSLVVGWQEKHGEETIYFSDPEATLIANEKGAQMSKAFLEWVEGSEAITKKVEDAFNDKYNRIVRTKHPAPKSTRFPGMAEKIVGKDGELIDLVPYEHQAIAVSRGKRNSTMFAHGVGFGKTWEMIMLAMELRRLSLAKKPTIVTTTSTFSGTLATIPQLYPGAKVHAPSAKDMDGTLERSIFLAQAAMNDWDIIVIPQSFLEGIPNDPQREIAWIEDEIAELVGERERIREQEGKDPMSVSDINAMIRLLDTRLKKLLDKGAKGISITFEDSGIDALMVDESHRYKKLPYRSSLKSSRQGVKGIDTGDDTGIGVSLLMKTRWIQERNRGRGVYFFTGTPVTNTIAELWTIMRFIRPDVLDRLGLNTFDAFQTAFTVKHSTPERTATGGISLVTRLARFRHIQQLMDAWLMTADVKFDAEGTGVERAGLEGGAPQVASLKPSPTLKDFVVFLAQQYKTWVDMEPGYKKDNGLQAIPAKISAWARLGALEPRYIDSFLEPDPDSKLSHVLKDVKRIYDETTLSSEDNETKGKPMKGVQLLFIDSRWSVDGQINIYRDIRRRLVALGIPQEEVLLFHNDEGVNSSNRQRLIDKANDGEYRVVIGSSSTLGTGVNIQSLAAAAHHLDAPWMPNEITQREGRAHRAGNMIYDKYRRLVRIVRWVAEGTYDGTLWAILSSKAGMVGQVIDGSYEGNEIADLGEEAEFTFRQAMAAATGDDRMFRREDVERKIKSEKVKKTAFFEQRRQMGQIIEDIERLLPKLEENLKRDEAAAARFANVLKDKDTLKATVAGKEIVGSANIEKALDGMLVEAQKKLPINTSEAIALGLNRVEGLYEAPVGKIVVGGHELEVTAELRQAMRVDEVDGGRWLSDDFETDPKFRINLTESQPLARHKAHMSGATGFFQAFGHVIRNIQDEPARIKIQMKSRESDLAEAKSAIKKEWNDTVLEVLEEELDGIKKSLAESPEVDLGVAEHAWPDIFMKAIDLKQLVEQRRKKLNQESEDESISDDDVDKTEEGEDGEGPDEPDDNGGGSGDDGVQEDRGGRTSSGSPKSAGGGLYSMTRDELITYFQAVFGHLTRPTSGRAGMPASQWTYKGKWQFIGYDAFQKWMDARYEERDLEGMRMAFIEQPNEWKAKYVRSSYKGSAHLKGWINHIGTGSPVPKEDPPVARTTPRPDPFGKTAGPGGTTSTPKPPKEGPPGGGAGGAAAPSREPTGRVKFDHTALVQFARELGNYPQVHKMRGSKLGHFSPLTRAVVLRQKLSWNPEQVTKTLAHELGHLVDLAITIDGKGKRTIARKLKPLEAMRAKIKDSAVLTRQAKLLSAEWRGEFTSSDSYRNSANELFADFFSAMLNDPEMVNQKYGKLHDAFSDLLAGKDEFRDAYNYITSLLTTDGMAERIVDQFRDDVKKSNDALMNQPDKQAAPIWESAVIATSNMWYRARKWEQERRVGSMLSDELEYSPTWAARKTALFENTWLEKMPGLMAGISKDYDEARAMVSAYSVSKRTLDEVRTHGKWIRENPDEAREVLRKIHEFAPGLSDEYLKQIGAVPDEELYDLAAKMFGDIHIMGEKTAERVARKVDQLKLGLSGHALLSAFNVRGKLLNPKGITPEMAEKILAWMHKDLGAEQFRAVEAAATFMREQLYDHQRQAYEMGLISEKVWKEMIEPNRNNYVPYAMINNFAGMVGAGVMAQHGSTQDTLDMVFAIPMKVAALNVWMQKQHQTETLRRIMDKAQMPYSLDKRLERASDIHKHLRTKDETSRFLYYIDGSPHIFQAFHDHGQTLQKAAEGNWFMEYAEVMAKAGDFIAASGQMYTTFNLAFMIYNNPIRGLWTAIGRFGLTATAKAAPKIPAALKTAFTHSRAMHGGVMNKEAFEHVRDNLLMPPRVARTMYGDAEAAAMLIGGGALLASSLNRQMLGATNDWWRLGRYGRALHEWFNTAMGTYESFEKIMHYESAKKKGFDQSKAIAMGRRGGIPNPTLGGKWARPMEMFFMWTRVHVQGLRITQEILRDPEQRKAYSSRFVLFELAPRMAAWAIGTGLALGLMGGGDGDDEDLEKDLPDNLTPEEREAEIAARKADLKQGGKWGEVFRRINPYKLALGRMIPLSFYDPRDGSRHPIWKFDYGKDIPYWYEVESLRVPSSEEGRLWGALFYNWMAAFGGKADFTDIEKGLEDLTPEEREGEVAARKKQREAEAPSMNFAGSEGLHTNMYNWVTGALLMEMSPIIKTGIDVGALSGGYNKRDALRGTPLVNKDLFEAGGMDRAQGIFGYAANATGGAGEVAGVIARNMGMDPKALDPASSRGLSDKIPWNELVPGGRAMVSHDNYSAYRAERSVKDATAEQRAKARLILPADLREMVRFYSRNKGREDKLDDTDNIRLQAAKGFTEHIWGDATKKDKHGNEVPLHLQQNHFYAKAIHYVASDSSRAAIRTLQYDLKEASAPLRSAFDNARTIAREIRMQQQAEE